MAGTVGDGTAPSSFGSASGAGLSAVAAGMLVAGSRDAGVASGDGCAGVSWGAVALGAGDDAAPAGAVALVSIAGGEGNGVARTVEGLASRDPRTPFSMAPVALGA
jgi:hypothetical protein